MVIHTCNAAPSIWGSLMLASIMYAACTYSDDDYSSITVDYVWIGEVTLTVEAGLIIRTYRKNVTRRTFSW